MRFNEKLRGKKCIIMKIQKDWQNHIISSKSNPHRSQFTGQNINIDRINYLMKISENLRKVLNDMTFQKLE